MAEQDETRKELLALLRAKSVFHGDFTLASGAKSKYYIDCRLTTLDGRGSCLVGQAMLALLRREQAALGISIDSIGGLTLGADPVSLAAAMASSRAGEAAPLRAFCVRKTPKAHGQTKLIEGNFKPGDTVAVVDDVITSGGSTITALNAIINEGGKIGFVAVLVDRGQGGREKIEAMGHRVFSIFTSGDLLSPPAGP